MEQNCVAAALTNPNPATKLELIENFLTNSTSNPQISPHAFSLQRSISDKLRNSFKTHANNVNINRDTTPPPSQLILPRKWHSERGHRPASARFSTQVPLTNHYKDILAQYAKAKQERQDNRIIQKLNKKFSLMTTTNKTTKKETKCTLYDFISQSNADNYDSSSSSNSSSSNPDTDNNELPNPTARQIHKTKRRNIAHHHHKMNNNETDSDTDTENEAEAELGEKKECCVCCEVVYLTERACCGFLACNVCVNMYLQTQIKKSCGSIRIECLNSECSKLFHRDEISNRMALFDREALKAYAKFIVDANKDSNCKTCPRCSQIMTITKPPLKPQLKVTKVQCSQCHLVWCFQCHAPWHNDITCTQFRKGDQMLKYWASEVHYGQQNAQLCPKCKIYIQRTKGCEHMVCMFCQTNFCYKCGRKFRHMKFIGDHYNRLSVLGCKYRFYPEKPAKRRIIRGGILCGKVLATPVVATLAAVLGVGALAVGFVAVPAYGSYRLAKHIHNNHSSRKPTAANKALAEVVQTQSKMSKLQNSGELLAVAEIELLAVAELNLIPREATTEPRMKEI